MDVTTLPDRTPDDEWPADIKISFLGPRRILHLDNFERFIEESVVENWEGVQSWIDPIPEPWCFRGHGDSTWHLDPSLDRASVRKIHFPIGVKISGEEKASLRLSAREEEASLILKFKQQAHHYLSKLPADGKILDWLALMQHFGAPTRLLDWTASPFVALYFATRDY